MLVYQRVCLLLISTGFYVITVYINHKWGDLLTYARFTVGLPPGPRAARWFPCQTSSRIFSGKHTIYHGTSWQFQPNHIQLHSFNCISQISWWHIVVGLLYPYLFLWISRLSMIIKQNLCSDHFLCCFCKNITLPSWDALQQHVTSRLTLSSSEYL